MTLKQPDRMVINNGCHKSIRFLWCCFLDIYRTATNPSAPVQTTASNFYTKSTQDSFTFVGRDGNPMSLLGTSQQINLCVSPQQVNCVPQQISPYDPQEINSLVPQQSNLRFRQQIYPYVSQQSNQINSLVTQQSNPHTTYVPQQTNPPVPQQSNQINPHVPQQNNHYVPQQINPRVIQQFNPRVPQQSYPYVPQQINPRVPQQTIPNVTGPTLVPFNPRLTASQNQVKNQITEDFMHQPIAIKLFQN